MITKKVLKFGGSSVGSPERIREIFALVSNAQNYPTGTIAGIVVSAFQGVTDTLINLTKLAAAKNDAYRAELSTLANRHLEVVTALIPATSRGAVLASVKVTLNELEELLQGIAMVGECTLRTRDNVISFGERLSSYIIAQGFSALGLPAEHLDTREVITTDESFGNALVDRLTTYPAVAKRISTMRAVPIIAGFIGQTSTGDTTTLGRGGSDLTAAIIGAALEVGEIEIWTDVDGILTADPRKVSKAFPLNEVSFEEAMELSHFGAKVIYPPTLQPAVDAGIPLVIKNTLNPAAPGTRVVKHAGSNQQPITGITSISSIALIRLQGSGMIGVSGIAARFFKALASAKLNVILITQASSEHTICCAIEPNQVEQARRVVEGEFALEVRAGLIDPLVIEQDLSIVSVVGESMRHSPGISGRLFASLGSNGVNVVAIAQGSSERNISAVVSKSDELKALNAIHDEFFINRTKTINLWLIGTGLIGSTLLKQLEEQKQNLRESAGLDIQLCGVANRRQMRLISDDKTSIDLNAPLSHDSQSTSLEAFIEHCLSANLPNTIFIDCTASDQVPQFYTQLLERSIAVVTPNKRAFSGPYEFYTQLRAAAACRRTPLLHETCVGAALPVLGTLSDLVRSGDSVTSIEAVLSGTLSFIFNAMSQGSSFSAAVLEAKNRGYTEPDPRDDLSGMDVARKVLILARDAGIKLELSEIEITPLLPPHALEWSVDEFMSNLPSLDPHFKESFSTAAKRNQRLFFAASIDRQSGTAKIGSREVGLEHPFCALSGADNIVAFTTTRYRETPLVVKGPGAGAEVTAAGIFADIIRAAR
jgi:aspartokinase/homoserine dehydrogenase 1